MARTKERKSPDKHWKPAFGKKAAARIAFACIREFDVMMGYTVSPKWEDLTEIQQADYSKKVFSIAMVKGAEPKDIHNAWAETMVHRGWIYGPTYSFRRKLHPLVLPWNDLPVKNKIKEDLFFKIVKFILKNNGKLAEGYIKNTKGHVEFPRPEKDFDEEFADPTLKILENTVPEFKLPESNRKSPLEASIPRMYQDVPEEESQDLEMEESPDDTMDAKLKDLMKDFES